ncbi:unnamed protein product [Amoebophrya sp. A25]|nr:unnamed protein product [Amoebophrya sp. A25]|eukprot:GSA25T00023691001.1
MLFRDRWFLRLPRQSSPFVVAILIAATGCWSIVVANPPPYHANVRHRLQRHFEWPEPCDDVRQEVPAMDRLTRRKFNEFVESGGPFILGRGSRVAPTADERKEDTEHQQDLLAILDNVRVPHLGLSHLSSITLPLLAPRDDAGEGSVDVEGEEEVLRETWSEPHCFATAATVHDGSISVALRFPGSLSNGSSRKHDDTDDRSPDFVTTLHPGDLLIYPPATQFREFRALSSSAGSTKGSRSVEQGFPQMQRVAVTAPLPARLLQVLGGDTRGGACREVRRDLALLGVQFPLLPSMRTAVIEAAKRVAEEIDTDANGAVDANEATAYFKSTNVGRGAAQPYFPDLLAYHDLNRNSKLEANEIISGLAQFSVDRFEARQKYEQRRGSKENT